MECQIKNIFVEKSCKKCAAKVSPRPLYNFSKYITQNRDWMQEILLKENYQKPLKKVTLFFLSNPAPFNRQNYQKQKGPGTSDQSIFRLQKKFRKIPL